MWTASLDQSRGAVRAGEGEWQDTGVEGVIAKKLFVDDLTSSVAMLIRMRPGAQYPAHHHGGTEQCYVIEGDLRVGDEVFTAGDYRYARSDSLDEVSSTVSGCLLFLISSQQDELLA
jgi:anti-sigma factor ChrR (cupin superfamily)